jgi:hypothetical protein
MSTAKQDVELLPNRLADDALRRISNYNPRSWTRCGAVLKTPE